VTKSPTLPVTAIVEYTGDGRMTISIPVDGKSEVMNRGTYKVEGETTKGPEKRAGQDLTLTSKVKTLTATNSSLKTRTGHGTTAGGARPERGAVERTRPGRTG
jgi:hypothetical protein